MLTLLLMAFTATYLTGPAGRDDLAARALRRAFPAARTLTRKGAP